MQNAISKNINQNLNINAQNAKPKFVLAPIAQTHTQNANSFKACFLTAINTVQPNNPISAGAILTIAQKQNGNTTIGAINTYLGYGINNNAINRYTNGTTQKTVSAKGKTTYKPVYFYAPIKAPITIAQLNTKAQNAKLVAQKNAVAIKT